MFELMDLLLHVIKLWAFVVVWILKHFTIVYAAKDREEV